MYGRGLVKRLGSLLEAPPETVDCSRCKTNELVFVWTAERWEHPRSRAPHHDQLCSMAGMWSRSENGAQRTAFSRSLVLSAAGSCEMQSPQIPRFTSAISLMTDLVRDDRCHDPSVKRQSQQLVCSITAFYSSLTFTRLPAPMRRLATSVQRNISILFPSCFITIRS